MRTAESLWHTMKLSPEGAAMHPAAADTLRSQSAVSAPCENGVISPQANPVLTPPVLTPFPWEAMAVPSPMASTSFSAGSGRLSHWAEGALGTSGPA